jgi:hypothetical protein
VFRWPPEEHDASQTLKLFADDEGIVCLHVRPTEASEQVGQIIVECEVDGKTSKHPIELRVSNTDTPQMPFPPRSRPPRNATAVRPALAREEALNLSKEELFRRGYPPRPDPGVLPLFQAWLRAVSIPVAIVSPVSANNTGVSAPAALTPVTLENWSGFQVLGGPFNLVAGVWMVPFVVDFESDPYRGTWSSLWVGIDGHLLRDLVQAGTTQNAYWLDWSSGLMMVSSYYAWTQFVPQQTSEQVIQNLVVNAFDDVLVMVELRDSNAFFYIFNLTTSESTTVATPFGDTVVRATQADWIMERPGLSNNTLSDLADYMPTKMSGVAVSVAGDSYTYQGVSLNGAPSMSSEEIFMRNGSDILSVAFPYDSSTILFLWIGYN